MGFVNAVRGVRAIGYLERDPLPPGPIALVTHSGSVFSAMLRTHRRLEYSVAVSSGQELVTTAADHLTYALSLPETKVVGLVLETLRDADTMRAVLADAASRDVPVVALTVGTSSRGRSLVDAHSGAIAGSDAAWEALFSAYGVHRVDDLGELADSLESFAIGRRVRRRAGGIATVHDSGAERVLAADVAERLGVPFAPLSEPTTDRLAGLLDPGLEPTNPLDVWGIRRRHRGPAVAVPDRSRRRPQRRRRRAGGRPGAGVRRRRVVPEGARPAGRPHRQAGRRAVAPRVGHRRAAGRRSARPRHPGARGHQVGPAGARSPARPRDTAGPPGPGGRPGAACAVVGPTARRRGRRLRAAGRLRDPGGDHRDGRRPGGRGGGGRRRRLPRRAQDRRPRHPPQARRRRRPAAARRQRRGRGGVRRPGRAARADGVGAAGGARGRRGRPRPVARPAARTARRWSRPAARSSSCWPSGRSRCRRSTRAPPRAWCPGCASRSCSPATAADRRSPPTAWSPRWWRSRSWPTSSATCSRRSTSTRWSSGRPASWRSTYWWCPR